MSVDKVLWYGLFGVQFAHLWIDWAEYTEETEMNWAGAWGIFEESKKFITHPDQCALIEEAYRFVEFFLVNFELNFLFCRNFADRLQQWDKQGKRKLALRR